MWERHNGQLSPTSWGGGLSLQMTEIEPKTPQSVGQYSIHWAKLTRTTFGYFESLNNVCVPHVFLDIVMEFLPWSILVTIVLSDDGVLEIISKRRPRPSHECHLRSALGLSSCLSLSHWTSVSSHCAFLCLILWASGPSWSLPHILEACSLHI